MGYRVWGVGESLCSEGNFIFSAESTSHLNGCLSSVSILKGPVISESCVCKIICFGPDTLIQSITPLKYFYLNSLLIQFPLNLINFPNSQIVPAVTARKEVLLLVPWPLLFLGMKPSRFFFHFTQCQIALNYHRQAWIEKPQQLSSTPAFLSCTIFQSLHMTGHESGRGKPFLVHC